MTPGEVKRTFARIEQSQREAHQAIDDRLANLAQQMVPASLWASEHKALADDVRHLESDVREGFERAERTSQERMGTLRGEITGVRGEVAGVRKAQAKHEEGHRDLGTWSRNKKLAVTVALIGASATLIAVWIAAVLAAKGVR
jgi:hypothetical protein